MKSRRIEVHVNGAFLAGLDTSKAVAADYLSFMAGVIGALSHPESLENEACASGRTISHPNFGALGSLSVKDSKGL